MRGSFTQKYVHRDFPWLHISGQPERADTYLILRECKFVAMLRRFKVGVIISQHNKVLFENNFPAVATRFIKYSIMSV